MSEEDPLVKELLKLRKNVQERLAVSVSREPIRIVIFDSQQRYDAFLRRNFPELPSRRAFFVKQNDHELVVFAYRGERLAEDLRHEGTHALLHSSIPNVPIWLDEGLAEYFETAPDGAAPTGHREALATQLHDGKIVPLERLEKLVDLWQMSTDDYRWSWLWVHFCLDHSPETRAALLAHLRALSEGKRDSLAQRMAELVNDPVTSLRDHLAETGGP